MISYYKDLGLSVQPYTPEGANSMPHLATLCESRDVMSNMQLDTMVEEKLSNVFARWKSKSDTVEPLLEMQRILELIRILPPSEERARKMNTMVRVLAEPTHLATYLDMLRDSASRSPTEEYLRCARISMEGTRHAVYGWSGQTLILESFEGATMGTFPAEDGLQEMIGNTTSEWGLSIHIWQPNPTAQAFPSPMTPSPHSVVEPPHTHPFGFVSAVVMGEVYQTRYMIDDGRCPIDTMPQRYPNGGLIEVDGVWPPHQHYRPRFLVAVERVTLQAGQSYYLPAHWIHDFEVDARTAIDQPSITLCLMEEFVVKPRSYISEALFEYHAANPDLLELGKALSVEQWHTKMEALSSYLRGDSSTLEVGKIVAHEDSYAFFHTHV